MSARRLPGCCALALLAALAAPVGTALAQRAATAPNSAATDSSSVEAAADAIVAEVNDHPIRLGQVGDVIRAMPDRDVRSFDALFPAVLHRLIEREAVVQRARSEGYADNPDVRRQMQAAADRVLESEYLRRKLDSGISEAALLARYDADVKGKPGPEIVHLRAILTPSEDQAVRVIALLGASGDFAALARRFSTDVSGAAGGDLGLVERSALSPEIAAAAFSLQPGQVTAYPVKTASGWFVLKVESRGRAPTPSFSEARPALAAAMLRERVQGFVGSLVNEARVNVYSIAGKSAGEGH